MLSPVYHLQRQLEAEHTRQAGWRTVCAGTGKPARIDAVRPGAELVCGPPGAHLGEPLGAERVERREPPEAPVPFVPLGVLDCSSHPFRTCGCRGVRP